MIETPSPAPHWFGFKQDWSNRVVKPKFHQQSRSESVSLLQPGQMCFMATHSSGDFRNSTKVLSLWGRHTSGRPLCSSTLAPRYVTYTGRLAGNGDLWSNL